MSDAFERAAERAEAEDRRRRQERAERGARTSFRIHATVYVAVQVMLVAVWAATGMGHPWFIYPLFGWGVGLAAHYAAVRGSFSGGPG